jgi:hypothetical protein
MVDSRTRKFPVITVVRTFLVDGVGCGGDYHNVEGGHWSVHHTVTIAAYRPDIALGSLTAQLQLQCHDMRDTGHLELAGGSMCLAHSVLRLKPRMARKALQPALAVPQPAGLLMHTLRGFS